MILRSAVAAVGQDVTAYLRCIAQIEASSLFGLCSLHGLHCHESLMA
jgi:hypothetical protein